MVWRPYTILIKPLFEGSCTTQSYSPGNATLWASAMTLGFPAIGTMIQCTGSDGSRLGTYLILALPCLISHVPIIQANAKIGHTTLTWHPLRRWPSGSRYKGWARGTIQSTRWPEWPLAPPFNPPRQVRTHLSFARPTRCASSIVPLVATVVEWRGSIKRLLIHIRALRRPNEGGSGRGG